MNYKTTNPTYNTVEMLRMLPELDQFELNIFIDLFKDELRRYCLLDVKLISRNIELRKKEIINQ